MENFRNYFEILGVDQSASVADIKQAFRQQARKYHPDLNPGDKAAEEKFKLLGEAYEVLSDPDRRSQYEQYSSFWQQNGFRQRVSNKFSFKDIDFSDLGDFNSFIDQLLNRRDEPARTPNDRGTPEPPPETRSTPRQAAASRTASRTSPANRRDAEATLTVPLERAYSGGQERIRLEDGRAIEVDMPPGMVTGQRIRLKGQGMGGGNLYLRIAVDPHPLFKLVDNDIFCRIPITPSEATIGSNITVPTLDGPVQMAVPPGVQTGKRLRLAGRGFPIGRDRRGDQIMEVDIVMPSTISDRERQLYQELRSLETFNPRAELLKSWQPISR